MKVIIADDSAVIRAILEQKLGNYSDIQISASLSNGKRLVQTVRTERPDIILSDSDMPELKGIQTLISLSDEQKIPIVILNDSDTVPETRSPLVEFIKKPDLKSYSEPFFESIVSALRSLHSKAQNHNSHKGKKAPHESSDGDSFKVLCIGASTGGPSAVQKVLCGLGNNFPLPILYVQHIDVGSDKNMVDWFRSVCPNLKVVIAQDGEKAKPGCVYMAPADRHLEIDYVCSNSQPVLHLSDDEPERFLRPAVNKLFRSAAQKYRSGCLAILLTGMGKDGAEGCKKICDSGGWTIVEDKSTCTVFGMPLAAIEEGGAKEVLPRNEIPDRILELVGKP